MTLLDQMLLKRGYTLAASEHRYGKGSIIVLLAYSEEAAYRFLDMFSSGDSINEKAETFEHENADYPIARGDNLIQALTKLEEKLSLRTHEELFGDGSEWRISIDVRLSEMMQEARV